MFYNVKLAIFEGPLDLLLHLIKKNEVDIYDIPIAFITAQYLEYIEMIKEMNLDLAGEFLVVAATLVHIKSRMLLPVDEEAAGEEEEGVDPRAELVEKLLEYQRYKEAAAELNGRLMLGRDVFGKGSPIPLDEIGEEAGYMNVSIFELMGALKGVLARAPKERHIDLSHERFRIADKINAVMETLSMTGSVTFGELFPIGAARGEIIVTFLAILELAKLLLAKLHQTEDGVIRVYAPKDRGHAAYIPAAEEGRRITD
ncbi:MAG: segregation/condensation protein A [Deltaproteobacteria bacterium]|nr:segregation/condensation protein A [Deltaproteobacteria bacterium]